MKQTQLNIRDSRAIIKGIIEAAIPEEFRQKDTPKRKTYIDGYLEGDVKIFVTEDDRVSDDGGMKGLIELVHESTYWGKFKELDILIYEGEDLSEYDHYQDWIRGKQLFTIQIPAETFYTALGITPSTNA